MGRGVRQHRRSGKGTLLRSLSRHMCFVICQSVSLFISSIAYAPSFLSQTRLFSSSPSPDPLAVWSFVVASPCTAPHNDLHTLFQSFLIHLVEAILVNTVDVQHPDNDALVPHIRDR